MNESNPRSENLFFILSLLFSFQGGEPLAMPPAFSLESKWKLRKLVSESGSDLSSQGRAGGRFHLGFMLSSLDPLWDTK